jgi:hypothetical protein
MRPDKVLVTLPKVALPIVVLSEAGFVPGEPGHAAYFNYPSPGLGFGLSSSLQLLIKTLQNEECLFLIATF